MSALEQEVIAKFYQLDSDAQQRVRDLISRETNQANASEFDYDAWFQVVEKLRKEIRASHGDNLPPMDVVSIPRDIRDGEDE
ncbi:MAG: hypothetical protein H6671_09990 [Anaerolineaceae bacterium]|nr:hypothetical protein [Anaerolineaceae bacterium]